MPDMHKAASRMMLIKDIERTKLQISGYQLKLKELEETLQAFDNGDIDIYNGN